MKLRIGFESSSLFLLVLGWLTYAWSLFDIASAHSVTILLVSTILIGAVGLWSRATYTYLWPVLTGTLMAFLVGLSVDNSTRTYTHLMQQLAGLFAAGGAASFAWDRHFVKFRKLLLGTGLMVLLYGTYQLLARLYVLPGAYLTVTNLQQEADGFQRGIERGFGWGRFTRASSVFVEPSDLGLFAVWLLAFGLGAQKKRTAVAALTLASACLLLSQSLGAFLAVCIIVPIGLVRRGLVGYGRVIAVTCLAIAASAYAFPDQTSAFADRIREVMALNEQADSNRLSRVPSNLTVALQSPWIGHGLGRNRDAEPNGIAIGILVLAVEQGAIGTVLFLAPFVVVGWKLIHSPLRDEYNHTAVMLLCATIYSLFAWFAALYFPIFWVSLGFAIWASQRTRGMQIGLNPAVFGRVPLPKPSLVRGSN